MRTMGEPIIELSSNDGLAEFFDSIEAKAFEMPSSLLLVRLVSKRAVTTADTDSNMPHATSTALFFKLELFDRLKVRRACFIWNAPFGCRAISLEELLLRKGRRKRGRKTKREPRTELVGG